MKYLVVFGCLVLSCGAAWAQTAPDYRAQAIAAELSTCLGGKMDAVTQVLTLQAENKDLRAQVEKLTTDAKKGMPK